MKKQIGKLLDKLPTIAGIIILSLVAFSVWKKYTYPYAMGKYEFFSDYHNKKK